MRSRHQTHPSLPVTDEPPVAVDSLSNWRISPIHDEVESTLDDFVYGWSLVQMYGMQDPATGSYGMPPRTLPERLATLLLALAEQQGVPTVHNVSSADLAESLGCSREAVASLLRAFRRQRMIDIRHNAIMLVDVEMVTEIGGLSL